MKNMPTRLIAPDATGIAQSAGVLRDGGLVAFPTETVYGVGADARNDTAIASIYTAKGRPSFNPLIVHIANQAQAQELCFFSNTAMKLAQAFWPGSLTLVLPLLANTGISKLVTAGLSTLAVRVPDHPIAYDLLDAFDGPIAAPSANPSGRISPTSAAHVKLGLNGKIDAIVDGGTCTVGLESTIMSCVDAPMLLRAGGITIEAIEDCLGVKLSQSADPAKPTAPGQLASHYAPKGRVRLNVTKPEADEILLGFGPVDAPLNLSPTGDLTQAAAHLFACLHQLDAMQATKIAVSPIPGHGLGQAINDRLKRAAAPH